MGRVLRLALLAVWLLPAVLPAQDRPRPSNPSQGQARGHQPSSRRDAAGPPPRPVLQLPGSNWVREPDLFRARPSTYAPRYDRTFRHGSSWRPLDPGYGYPVFYAEPTEPPGHAASAEEFQRDRRSLEESVSREFDQPIAPPAAQAPVAPAPVAAPRTFYVIPRCYAGDAPPRPDQLPPGCTVAALRVVPPRAFAR